MSYAPPSPRRIPAAVGKPSSSSRCCAGSDAAAISPTRVLSSSLISATSPSCAAPSRWWSRMVSAAIRWHTSSRSVVASDARSRSCACMRWRLRFDSSACARPILVMLMALLNVTVEVRPAEPREPRVENPSLRAAGLANAVLQLKGSRRWSARR